MGIGSVLSPVFFIPQIHLQGQTSGFSQRTLQVEINVCLIWTGCSMQLWGALEAGSPAEGQGIPRLDGVLTGRCVKEKKDSGVCCQHGRCHWMRVCLCASCRSTQQGAAPPKPPPPAAPRSGAPPAPHSSPLILLPPSQPQPEIRGLSRPSWGRASRWLQGLGGRVGRPETKPVQQFSRAELGSGQGPVCPLPGGGQTAGAQRGTGLGQGLLLLPVQSQLTDAKVLFAHCQE